MVKRSPYQFEDVESHSLLLVEGMDDARFMNAFLKSINKSGVQISIVKGKTNLGKFLSNTLAKTPNLARLNNLAIVRDADNDPQAVFQSLRDLLAQAKFLVPVRPWAVQQGKPSVSVAILPDENSPGNLEDLCLRSVEGNPESMNALECVDRYISCRNTVVIPESKRSKARLHTYLAVADKPGRRLGEAADAGIWDWNSPTLQTLADFLRQL